MGGNLFCIYFAGQPGTLQVGVDNEVPVVFVNHGIGFGTCLYPGVVDEYVQPPVSLEGVVYEMGDTVFVTDIQNASLRLSTERSNFRNAGFEFLQPARAEDNLGACRGQHAGKVVAKARRCAGDGDHFVL